MVVFKLTMPNCGSWNGKWSGEKDTHIITKSDKYVPKELIGKSFCYHWDDGWTACIEVIKINGNSAEYRNLVKNNKGFCGYDWMVHSILLNGEIIYKT